MANTSVSYNGNRIIPAPFVSIQKEYNKTGDGQIVGASYNIALIGKLIFNTGSPNDSGTFYTGTGYPANDTSTDALANLSHKIEGMRTLFSVPGKNLEIQGCGGTAPIKCYPVMKSINFPEGPWYQTVDYTVNLEANEMFGLGGREDGGEFFASGLYLKDANEEWSIEFNEQGESVNYPYTYKVSHNVNAVGMRNYDGGGLQSIGYSNAKRWVLTKLGVDNTFLYGSGGLNIPTFYNPYNYIRTENINELGGSYAIVENWIIASGTSTEDFKVSIKRSVEEPSVKVSIDGSINGLEVKNSDMKVVTPKIDNAEIKLSGLLLGSPIHQIYNRAQQYGGIGLNFNPLSYSIMKDPFNGIISYTYDYDDRPYNMVSGSLMESFNIQGTNSVDVFASISVPGRTTGPILQNMNTITAPKFSINIEILMPRYSGIPNSIANALAMKNSSPRSGVQEIVDNFRGALNTGYSIVFVDNDNEVWNPRTGRYSRDISWTYGSC
jgi:hypothetical protein